MKYFKINAAENWGSELSYFKPFPSVFPSSLLANQGAIYQSCLVKTFCEENLKQSHNVCESFVLMEVNGSTQSKIPQSVFISPGKCLGIFVHG
jgi:hypothetical protein